MIRIISDPTTLVSHEEKKGNATQKRFKASDLFIAYERPNVNHFLSLTQLAATIELHSKK